MQTEELRRERRPGGEGEGDNAVLFFFSDPGVSKKCIRKHGLFSRGEEREPVLESCDDSSLEMDRLFDQV